TPTAAAIPSAEKNRGRPVRGRARRRLRAACTAIAARSPSRWTTARYSAARNRTWSRPPARSPSFPDPYSRRQRDSRDRETPATCARTSPASPSARSRTCPPARARRARRASRIGAGRRYSCRLAGFQQVNRELSRPFQQDDGFFSLLQLICNCIWPDPAYREPGGLGGATARQCPRTTESKEVRHVRHPRGAPPAPDLQPSGLVQSCGAIG